MHQSFDFAQQVFLPQDSQQVGPLYFLCGYKVGLFGIAVEPLRKFVLYIIPEAAHCGKGSNVVISLLHHFYTNFSVGETDSLCHADNCCGQNKNNFMMQYCLWRTATGQNQSFQISFMPVGHTKFWPDLLFGLFKKRWRREQASSVADVQRIARECCPGNVFPVAVGDEAGHTFVPIYDWQSKFKAHGFHKIPEIKKFHHFFFTNQSPGIVSCKTSLNSDSVRFTVGEVSTLDKSLPNIIHPVGLSYARKLYLYNSIRQYVPDDSKDTLCPLPCAVTAYVPPEPTAEPGTSMVQDAQNDDGPTNKDNRQTGTVQIEPFVFQTPEKKRRKTPTCSYCLQAGHRNQTIRGRLVCPKRREDIMKPATADHVDTD
ncbi:uncharacterized protein LOC124263377 [Haliotis rubra]|uniref:uncharacterized protein LOC124263377 n=1 Tax=Haliotis rubra TaxID=36100 RepID=UPI001EE5B680|nr:uncharacterized protein LOC124263377 [Haliotis rubra]